MEHLLPYFERELVMLRHQCREFAERYPKIAGKLQISGESCEDPHVEHLIESVAMLAARIAKRLDDDYPQFTEALFETLFPHYLRPFPSCAIVRLPAPELHQAMLRLPAGTGMVSAPVRGVECRFRTVYDIVVGGVTIDDAAFEPLIKAPLGARLPPGAGSALRIRLRQHGAPAPALPASLRVFIDAEPSFAAALRDALFMQTLCAYVETDAGQWIRLPAVPVTPAGFADADALLPFGARSQPAYRILGEYFAYPEKFNFFDLDLAALRAGLPIACQQAADQRYTLHLCLAVRADSDGARMLASLSVANLQLGCSPVVNLFRVDGVPVSVTRQKTEYPVLAHATHAHGYEVLAIDSVHSVRQGGGDASTPTEEVPPLYGLRHGDGAARHGRYWIWRHDAALALKSPGHEKKIALIDADFNPLTDETLTLSLALSCSNRDLPLALKYGQPQGDLAGGGAALRLLRRPSPSRRFASGMGLHWRLISHLALNQHALTQQGLPALREMLALYDPVRSATSQRQIGAIAALEQVATTTWLRHRRGASLAHGVEVRITLDEEAFAGSGMHLFVQVIDHFLGLYVQMNSFIELVVLSLQSGEELIRCKPRSGMQQLV